MRTLEIQDSLLVYSLLGCIFMAELSLSLGVELPAIGPETDVRAIVSAFSRCGLDRLCIVGCSIRCDKVTLIVT